MASIIYIDDEGGIQVEEFDGKRTFTTAMPVCSNCEKQILPRKLREDFKIYTRFKSAPICLTCWNKNV